MILEYFDEMLLSSCCNVDRASVTLPGLPLITTPWVVCVLLCSRDATYGVIRVPELLCATMFKRD